ncbi:MAG: hypothetical protein ACOX1G_08840 [bacterium]
MFKVKNIYESYLRIQTAVAGHQYSKVRDGYCGGWCRCVVMPLYYGVILALFLLWLLPRSVSAEEIYRIRAVNQKNGAIELSSDRGKKWARVGNVLKPATNNNPNSFSAGRWVDNGCVAGVATHSIHIKVGCFPAAAGKKDRAVLISLVPCDFQNMSTSVMVRQALASCIVTDIPAGASIFRSFAPFVGNRVFLEREGSLVPVLDNYRPATGDVLLIVVDAPARYPEEIVFENRAGGKVTSVYADGSSEDVARVVRAVGGIGRFEGTSWAGPGRITSNHPGVITVSTAPFSRQALLADALSDFAVESRGGFQIVPWEHARDSRLEGSQWMTVAPLNDDDPPIDGRDPLFSRFISLSYEPQRPELSSEVQIRLDDGPWESIPQIIGKVDNAFEPSYLNAYYTARGCPRRISTGITHIRILLPRLESHLSSAQLEAGLHSSTGQEARLQAGS